MKRIIQIIILAIFLSLGLTGCEGDDYNKAVEFQESGDYVSALEIYKSIEGYKDSKERIGVCNTMIEAINEFNKAKSDVEQKNSEMDTAISAANNLIMEKKPALDSELITALETAISETKAAKKSVPEMPTSPDAISTTSGELKLVDYKEVLLNLSSKKLDLEKSINQYALVNAPTESYIIKCLQKVPNVIDISAVTEDNDPNGKLNKVGGYTAHVYFSSDLVDQNEVIGDTVIERGTDGGGSIEVYATVDYANARNDYLASFDGGILASGSHTVVGTVVVRTSDELTASQQKTMEANIIAALTSLEE